MAAWQSTLRLVPRGKAIELCAQPPDRELFDLVKDIADVDSEVRKTADMDPIEYTCRV